jgi:hypothetical protein
MQGRDDVGGFIAGFAGDDRYAVDYLAEEVLARQSDRVRAFLLQTCILGRLSGPLCDAVTGQGGGKGMLEALDRGSLFLVSLDDRRREPVRSTCRFCHTRQPPAGPRVQAGHRVVAGEARPDYSGVQAAACMKRALARSPRMGWHHRRK